MDKKYAEKASEKERLFIESGYASAVERDPEKRFRLLQELVKKYPQEKEFHSDLGLVYEGRSRYPEAIAEYEKALTLDPNFGPALNEAGYTYVAVGELEKALQYFKRYAAANPGEANPIDSIAELYFRMGKFDEAKAKYQEALEIRPDFSGSCRGLAYLSAIQENYQEARHWLEEFVERAPTPAEKSEGYWLKAYFDYFLGRWDESLVEYSAVKEQREKSGQAMVAAMADWMTGFIRCDHGEYNLARQSFQRCYDFWLKRNPAYRSTYLTGMSFVLGWVDLKEGRLEAAKAKLKEIESLLPSVDPASQGMLTGAFRLLNADVLLADNLPEKAIDAGQKIGTEDFQNMNMSGLVQYNTPFLKDVLARAYWKKGDLDKAIAVYQRLTTIDPNNQVCYLIHPLYHYRLGLVYEQKGEKARAASEYEKFLAYWKDADPGLPEVEDARKRLAGLKG
jgi:tetratricopeptide (TPR) repeat protein